MERMEKEKESGTLLGVGTAYLQAKEIKGEFYVKASDFNRCMDGIRIEQEADRKHIEELEEENKKIRDLKCVPSNLKTLIRIDKENERLEEENKKLKSDLSFERTMLDNVKAEYESSQEIIKKLKEELSKYKKQYEHSMGDDEWKKRETVYVRNSEGDYVETQIGDRRFMEEDTLQELRDLGEI